MRESDINEPMAKPNNTLLEDNLSLPSVVVISYYFTKSSRYRPCSALTATWAIPPCNISTVMIIWTGTKVHLWCDEETAPFEMLILCWGVLCTENCNWFPKLGEGRAAPEGAARRTVPGTERQCSRSWAHHEWELLPEITRWDSGGINERKRDN